MAFRQQIEDGLRAQRTTLWLSGTSGDATDAADRPSVRLESGTLDDGPYGDLDAWATHPANWECSMFEDQVLVMTRANVDALLTDLARFERSGLVLHVSRDIGIVLAAMLNGDRVDWSLLADPSDIDDDM